jgi:hypothetical protein
MGEPNTCLSRRHRYVSNAFRSHHHYALALCTSRKAEYNRVDIISASYSEDSGFKPHPETDSPD